MVRHTCSLSINRRGEELARIETSELSRYGMMTFQHDGHQYVMAAEWAEAYRDGHCLAR